MAIGLVGGTCFVSDVVVVDPLVGSSGISSVAAFIGELTGNEDLWGQVDVGELSLPGDLDAVAESRSGGEGPAGSAVDGDVLVSLESEIVGSVDISPEIILGKLSNRGLGDRGLDVRMEVIVVNVGSVHVNIKEAEGADEQEGE